VAVLGQRDLERVSVTRFDEGELEIELLATTPALYSTDLNDPFSQLFLPEVIK
jgi:hypothetical protein